MKSLEETSEELDKQRREALETRTAITYYELCEKQGITPEDQLLHELGYLESKESKPNKNPADLKIRKFLSEAKNVNITNYFFDVPYKKDLLIRSFPNKFGPKGTQNLDKYNDGQIGSIFEKVVINYLKKV